MPFDFSTMRGFNYQPSYAARLEQIWTTKRRRDETTAKPKLLAHWFYPNSKQNHPVFVVGPAIFHRSRYAFASIGMKTSARSRIDGSWLVPCPSLRNVSQISKA